MEILWKVLQLMEQSIYQPIDQVFYNDYRQRYVVIQLCNRLVEYCLTGNV